MKNQVLKFSGWLAVVLAGVFILLQQLQMQRQERQFHREVESNYLVINGLMRGVLAFLPAHLCAERLVARLEKGAYVPAKIERLNELCDRLQAARLAEKPGEDFYASLREIDPLFMKTAGFPASSLSTFAKSAYWRLRAMREYCHALRDLENLQFNTTCVTPVLAFAAKYRQITAGEVYEATVVLDQSVSGRLFATVPLHVDPKTGSGKIAFPLKTPGKHTYSVTLVRQAASGEDETFYKDVKYEVTSR